MAKSRVVNSIKGSVFGLLYQIGYSFLYFIVRTVFIKELGKTYLGLNGLFSDILTLLSLAELGFGTAIVYFMYKPFAKNDYRMVSALLSLYGKVYKVIGTIITVVGLCLTPFLDYIITGMPEIPEIRLIYLLFLFNTSLSYFWVYKRSMLIVDQKIHISYVIQLVTICTQYILQVIILILMKNFVAYLVVQVLCTLVCNIVTSKYVDKHYKYLKKNKDEKLPKDVINTIIVNIKAMFTSKLSSAVVTSTDNLLISTFVSTISLGLYSNYLIFVNLIRQLTSKVFEAVTGSLGNMLAKESEEKAYEVYMKMLFANFAIVSFCTTCLFALIEPLIKIWIGSDFLLPMNVQIIICINLYMRLIRNTSLTYCDTYGLFKELKVKCIMEAVLNIIFSLLFILPFKWGIFGVLVGTFASNLCTNFWYEPYVLFKLKFKMSQISYYKAFFSYLVYTVVIGTLMYYITSVGFNLNLFLEFILKGFLCVFAYAISFYICFGRTDSFVYYKEIALHKARK